MILPFIAPSNQLQYEKKIKIHKPKQNADSTICITALSILQHYLYYSTIYITALSILQHYLYYSTIYITVLSILQHYLYYSTIYITHSFTVKPPNK